MGIEPGPSSGGAAAHLAAVYNSGRKRRKEPLIPQDPASFALDRAASSNLLVPSRSPRNGPHATAATGIANEAAVRRKRGRPPKVGPAKSDSAAPPAASASASASASSSASASASKRCKKEEEDVCFICFDGGNLVLCDRRDCPKAYHPACVKRDESFFRLRVKWNCGWHLCNICQRNALFLCYMCPYSLCKACVRQADILCVRGNKGFCRTCMTTISLIENINQGNKDMGHIDFDDTTNWEYLFKVYWIYLKQKESFTLEELTKATNPWKEQMLNCKNDVYSQVHNDTVSRTIESNCPTQMTLDEVRVEVNVSKRRKTRKQPAPEIDSPDKLIEKSQKGIANWASKELLEFVAHMKKGDTSSMSQFEVQALLLEYIKRNNLRDPHGKSHVICDQRLEVLFGKTRVGHFEMLDLLERHFKEVSCMKRMVRGAADSSTCQLEAERCSKDTNTANRQKKRQGRKKAEERIRQMNLDKYAAIDVHNISLIYLKRYLVENLLDDVNKFDDHVVGSVVRIRIYGNDLKQDMYRLVRVVGTSKAAEPYKVGDKTADVMLKILNLDKIEDVGVDAISNQDFSEDECRRLRQSIKCGLMERMTVGVVQKKAIALQAIRVGDVLEAEILKLNHLCDRANELGHRKELREYVEKVELLKSPEERQRRVLEIPEVHVDPRMDPGYHSEEDSLQLDPRNIDVMATKCSNSDSKPMELFTPRRGDTRYSARAKVLRCSSTNQEIKTSMSIGSQASKDDSPPKSCESTPSSLELETDAARILEELSKQADLCRLTKQEPETSANNPSPQIASSDASVTSSSTGFVLSCDPCELEKLWHYQDPSGKVQGPFCMLQMRKWHMYGYFPSDLRIWKVDENPNSSVLLTDALSMHCHNNNCQCQSNNTYLGSEDAKVTSDCRKPEHNGGQSSSNFNTDVIRHKRNADCDSGMVDGPACSGDEKPYEIGGNNGKGEGFQCSEVSSEENQKSPSGESSLTKEEVAGPPLVSSATGSSATRNCSYEQEDQKVGNEGLKSSKMETEVLPTSDIPGKRSGTSSWGVSSREIEFSNLQTVGTEPEKGDTKVEKSENKGNNDDIKDEAVGDRRPQEPSAVPDQNMSSIMNSPSRDQSKIEFSNLVSDIEEVDNKGICSRTGETKPSTCLDLPGRDSGRASWNAMSSGIDLSIPASSAVPENEGMNDGMSMGHCVASGVPCHDLDVSWSTASSLAVNEPFHISNEWVGYSHMHSRPCSEIGADSRPSIKFGEPSGENAITFDWLDGPIELATLGDESVSDLLSEVEALESMNGGMMNCVLDLMDSPSNDCFSPLAGLSPTLDPGKSDAWSSTCDVQSHSQTATVGEPQHHHIIFGLNLHDCSTKSMNSLSNSGTEGEKEMKLGLGSSDARQDLTFSAHASPSDLPNLNYVCSSGQRFEGDTFDFQDLGSQGCPTVPLPLPSSAGPKISLISEGEIEPVYLSKNHQNFLPQDQTLPLPPCASRSMEFSLSPEDKGKVNHTFVAMSREEVPASVNFPLPTPSPSQSPPIMSNISSPMGGKEFKQIQVSPDKLSPSSQELPLPAPPPPASKADSSFPREEQIDLSSPPLPPQPSPQPSPPPVSLQPPPTTTSQDIPLTLAEEGESEPITSSSSMEQTCQSPPKSHSPLLPSPPPHVPEIKASSPIEEGEMKPMSHLPERQQKALLTSQSIPPVSTRIPSFKSPSLDTSIDIATGRLPTKESSTFYQSGPFAKTATTTGRPNLHRDSDMHHVAAAEQHSKPTTDDGSRRFRKAFWSEGSELLPPLSLTSRYGSGFVKPNRHSWNRQPLFGSSAGGGGSPRQLPPGHSSRGSRICKFYKSGYCKKGALCNYLHPS